MASCDVNVMAGESPQPFALVSFTQAAETSGDKENM